jgi:hypothetical protein
MFAGDIGLSADQINRLLARTRPAEGHERSLDDVVARCFEMFGKRIWVWRVPGADPTFSVVARV